MPPETCLMPDVDLTIDADAAVARLLRFIAIEGITGEEKAIAQEVVRHLIECGVPRTEIRYDKAAEEIPLPCETGNLIVTLPGNRPGPRRLFVTHLDTVPLCAGAEPVRRGMRVEPMGETALGGDNRTGVAALVTLAATLMDRNLPYPPVTLLFTVREESGLWGAHHVDLAGLGDPIEGYNIDGSSPREMTIGAAGAERWEVEIFGRAAHAGAHPEQGISATAVASLAIADAVRGGWHGKIVRKGGKEGTANVGVFGGRDGQSAGEATNVVTDYVLVRGESRSHDMKFVREITEAWREAFRKASGMVHDDRNRPAKYKFTSRRDYFPFALKPGAAVVKHSLAAARSVGWEPTTRITNGGLDANWLVRHGIPTVTFGAGQRNVHTLDEYVDLDDFLDGCRLALVLATAP